MSLQLHLGCGKRFLPGFEHVDKARYGHITYNTDIRKLAMYHSNSVDLIYASHCFEYFDRFEAMDVLREWRRVLKKGGILRLAVPDFGAMAELYTNGAELKKFLGPLYGRWVNNGDRFPIYHKTTYDFESMCELLTSNGFKNINEWDWKEVLPVDFDDFSKSYIPHMDFENGTLISLNVEAEKE